MRPGSDLNPFRALVLAAIAGIGLYAIGTEAAAHRRAIRGGELPTHIPEGFTSSAADDVVAFVAGTTAVGMLIMQVPAMVASVEEWVR